MATVSEALEIAFNLHMAGHLDEAAAIYRPILDADPEHIQTLRLFGTLLCQQDRMEEARPLLEQAASRGPGIAGTHLNLARIDLREGSGDAAARRLRPALALDPASAEAWDLASVVEHQCGRLDNAIAALQRAFRTAPTHGGIAERLGLLLHNRGLRHLDEQRHAAAVGDLSQAVRLLPFDADAVFALATGLGELGRGDEACAAYRRVLVWGPAEPRVLHNLGVTLLHAGHRGPSASTLRRAVAAAPDYADPHEALTALFDRRNPEQAAFWSTKALGLKLAAAGPAARESALRPVNDPSRTRDVVSYSLWGGQEVYCGGAVANAGLIPALLPGWVCRFYHDDTVPEHILAELTSLGAELVAMPPGTAARQGMFWRFLPSDDPTVRRFLCRDCDSRPTGREIAAVEEWVASGQPFHVMRDHVMHLEPVMGGMWGGTAGMLPPVGPAIDRFTASRSARWNDQHFLAEWLWPRIAGSVLVHDGVHRDFGLPFPGCCALEEGGHVGAKLLHLKRLPEIEPPDRPDGIGMAQGQDGDLAYPADDPHVGRSLALLGEWLGIETAFCAGLLATDASASSASDIASSASGMTASNIAALDMDAGIGVHALALARAAGAGRRVAALEDRSGLRDCLRRTISGNRLESVVVGLDGTPPAEAMPEHLAAARPGLVRASLSRFGGTFGDRLAMAAACHAATLYLRLDDDAAAVDAFARLERVGYRLWWHLAPVFNPFNRLGAARNPFAGLVSINVLALPPGRRLPVVDSLAPVGTAGAAGWHDAAWRLRVDGR